MDCSKPGTAIQVTRTPIPNAADEMTTARISRPWDDLVSSCVAKPAMTLEVVARDGGVKPDSR